MMFKKLHFKALALGILFLAAACKDDSSNSDPIDQALEAPSSYRFERNGLSTVSYSGQSTRLAMGAELNAALLDFNLTSKQLEEMFANADENGNDVDPFQDPQLNASTKSLRSKTASSYLYFNTNSGESAAIKSRLSNYLTMQVQEIFPYANQAAAEGVAGQIADGSAVRYVSAKGLEYNQAFGKGLIGALFLDQLINNYLDPGVLDAGSNRADNEAKVTVESEAYTAMEHKWDEAYGYLFGGAEDGAAPLATLGADDDFLNKYLARVDADPDFSGMAAQVYNALKLGRAAIVAGDYELRDDQADIVKEHLSALIGIRSIYYLQSAKAAMANGDTGTAFHDLSEAYGFIYSLRFTQNPISKEAYFDGDEVQAFLDRLMNEGPNGFWDLSAATLDAISTDIADRFNFSLSQASKS
ncbi:MAG: DUF4856 domain-containing protein [Croceimicrobium sp.]